MPSNPQQKPLTNTHIQQYLILCSLSLLLFSDILKLLWRHTLPPVGNHTVWTKSTLSYSWVLCQDITEDVIGNLCHLVIQILLSFESFSFFPFTVLQGKKITLMDNLTKLWGSYSIKTLKSSRKYYNIRENVLFWTLWHIIIQKINQKRVVSHQ